ncbi:MAG: AEC family transporter, partial [Clostridia bacterium]|nr:AEC family transporter [Clostridia bacterium]
MEMFFSTLSQMLMMFTLIAAGFVLRKCSILPLDSDTGMARAETFIFGPALYIGTQMNQCTVEMFSENYTLIIYGLIITVSAIIVAYPMCRIFVRTKGANSDELYRQSVYKYALAFGNYGFMGNFIALTVFGEAFLNKYILFTFFVGILCLTWGLFVLVPKDQGVSIWKNLKKGLLNPMTIGLLLGMVLGLLNVKEYVPAFLSTALTQAGACQGPVAMILAGFVIGGYNLKELLLDGKVYLATLFRLILIPAVMLL